MGDTISAWLHAIIDGPGGLHDFEARECASPVAGRDEAVAAWVVRCLANPHCEGSRAVLDAIIQRREGA